MFPSWEDCLRYSDSSAIFNTSDDDDDDEDNDDDDDDDGKMQRIADGQWQLWLADRCDGWAVCLVFV